MTRALANRNASEWGFHWSTLKEEEGGEGRRPSSPLSSSSAAVVVVVVVVVVVFCMSCKDLVEEMRMINERLGTGHW